MDARLFHIFGTEEKTKELAKMDNINQKDLAIQKSFLDVRRWDNVGPCLLSTSTTRSYIPPTN